MFTVVHVFMSMCMCIEVDVCYNFNVFSMIVTRIIVEQQCRVPDPCDPVDQPAPDVPWRGADAGNVT